MQTPRRLHAERRGFVLRVRRRARLLGVLAAALAAGVCSAAPSSTDLTIRFLEDRLRHDADDFIAAGKLGDTYLQKAREDGVTDVYLKAERSLREALKWNSNSYALRVSLASALMGQHRFHDAASLGGKLASEFSNSPGGHAVLGDALLEIGDVPGAESAYRKLWELAPGLGASARLAKLSWLRGDVPGAFSNWTQALSFSNSPVESLAWAHVQRGELLFRTGQWTNAQREYESALHIFPNYHAALDHIAELHAGRGEFETARQLFEQLAERTQRPEYLQAIGDLLVAARKANEAKSWHDRALAGYLRATEQGSVAFFHHLAGFYCDSREDGVEAEKWARRDLEVRQNIYAWDALAWAMFVKRDYPAAADAMKRALAFGTKDAHVLAHAGSIFVRAGRIKEGQDFMRRATEANPHFGDFHVHR